MSSMSRSQMISGFAPSIGISLNPTPRQGFASGMVNSLRSLAIVIGSSSMIRRKDTFSVARFARLHTSITC
ncbi:hypothetical protein EVA_10350 [gut metagenome]|uniref:Uncharacterized protein n=1 Tax=gut metagenome TaxID=749906 RepID=J9GNS2_9ZZZZ